MSKEIENKQWQFKNDDEWYTFKKDVKRFLDHIKIPKNKIIWCPFDNNSSAFPIVLKEEGYKVIISHIFNDQDFYTYEPKEKYDIIMSNPPFKGKANVIDRLLHLDKPFALIFGIQCFSSGGFNLRLSLFNNLKMVFIQKRMKFHKGIEDPKLPSPTFHSMWICNEIENLDKISFIIDSSARDRKNE